jgi:AraC family transcriptional regulator
MRDDAHLLPQDGDFGQLHTGFIDDPVIKRLLTDLWEEVEYNSPHAALFADGALMQLVARLLDLRTDYSPLRLRTVAGGLTPRQERQAVDFLSSHLTEAVSLDTLAEVAQLSTWHFARSFKASTGLPPHAYLRRLRCEKATALLRDTSMPIQEIAAAVGYETPQVSTAE